MQMMLAQMAQEQKHAALRMRPHRLAERRIHMGMQLTEMKRHGSQSASRAARKHMRPEVIRNQRCKAIILNGHKLCIRTFELGMWAVR